jgi:hypothetical protein
MIFNCFVIVRAIALCALLLQLASCAYVQETLKYEEADSPKVRALEEVESNSPDMHPDIASYPLIVPVLDTSAALLVPAGWHHYRLPGKKLTHYKYERADGRHAIKAKAASSASMLRQSVRVTSQKLRKLNFSWKVPQLIPGADLAQRETHDSPVRVVLVFEGDRSTFSAKNAMLSELARALTGEELPYATLMYVWCNTCKSETALVNPRTDRIREVAIESGPKRLNRWINYQRDIRADYEKAFGEAPGALIDVGIMTDTDNTRQNAVAWYGAISLSE